MTVSEPTGGPAGWRVLAFGRDPEISAAVQEELCAEGIQARVFALTEAPDHGWIANRGHGLALGGGNVRVAPASVCSLGRGAAWGKSRTGAAPSNLSLQYATWF